MNFCKSSKGNYTDGFVTGKCWYTYELATYAPVGLNILKIVIPQNKTLVSVNLGPNEMEGNELTYHNYNWIHPLDIHYTEKSSEIISANIGKEWELPKPQAISSEGALGREKAIAQIPTNNYSRFAYPNLWIGTGVEM